MGRQAVNIAPDNLEADTSSYRCSVDWDLALDQIEASLAIGFYCDKDDFDDFCSRASELVEKASGAPLFTVVHDSPLRGGVVGIYCLCQAGRWAGGSLTPSAEG